MGRPAHNLYVVEGVFGSTSAPIERWQIGLRTDGTTFSGATTQTVMDGLAEGLRTAWDVEMKENFSEEVIATKFTVVGVQADGHWLRRGDGSFVKGENTEASASTQDAVDRMPLQTALVVSLLSNRAGPTGKGRIFLPWPNLGLEDDYRTTVAACSAVAGTVAAFIRALNELTTAPVAVVSSKGYASEVMNVRVGRVPDTHRSRRSDEVEGYYTRTVAPS